jgi:hypothetical protein
MVCKNCQSPLSPDHTELNIPKCFYSQVANSVGQPDKTSSLWTQGHSCMFGEHTAGSHQSLESRYNRRCKSRHSKMSYQEARWRRLDRRCTSSLPRPLQLLNKSLPRSLCTKLLLSTSCTCPEHTPYTALCRQNQSIQHCKCSWLEHCSETVRWSLTYRLCTMLQRFVL